MQFFLSIAVVFAAVTLPSFLCFWIFDPQHLHKTRWQRISEEEDRRQRERCSPK